MTVYTDALERTVTFTRNSKGSVTQETYPGSVTRSYTYGSAYQQPLTATDENGHTTTYAYYGNHLHLQTATGPLNQVTTYTWTGAGLLQSVTDPRGVTTSYAYDAFRRLEKVVEALGTADERTTTMLYDGSGNLLSVTRGLATGSSTLAAHAVTTSYAYDAFRRQTLMTEAWGTALERVTTTAYEADGRLRSVTDPLGRVTSFAYDALGRRTRTVEALVPSPRTSFPEGASRSGPVPP